MSFLRTRRGLLLAGFAFLLLLFLVRPGAARLKSRLVSSIGQALQRQVEIESVHVHLLPRPGFDFENFVVHDDPAFSAEPMLRAQEVSASIRLLALLRARLEVSRLSLTEPSLNLVRNPQGRWNIATILEHAAATPAGPTGKSGSVSRPEFPYIEADRGRINFKLGSEKKPFALSDADYAFWQESDSSWGMRLKAVPLRTDFNLTDTGILRASGTWQRADRLRDTPVQFTVLWEGAQLGQVTKLISGADRGWRGTVRAQTNLSGSPASLAVVADASVDDFRRYDLAGAEPLRLGTHCVAQYSVNDGSLGDIACISPGGGTGRLTLTGAVQRLLASPRYDLALDADALPVPTLLALARRSKKNLPGDLEASGVISFHTAFKSGDSESGHSLQVAGKGSIQDFTLRSAINKADLTLGDVPLVFASEALAPNDKRSQHARNQEPDACVPRLIIGPVHFDRATALAIQGSLTAQGYRFSAAGEAGVQRLLRAARTVGLPAVSPVADGNAKLELSLVGDWRGFTPPRINGSVQLKATHVELRGLGGPIEIAAASLRLTADQTDVSALSANAAGAHWTGSFSLPRACPSVAECPVSFNLQADELTASRLRSFLNPTHPTPWYKFQPSEASGGSPLFRQLHASGKLSANRLVLLNLTATHAASSVTLTEGKLHLANLTAEVLGGKHTGAWDADFTVQPPVYSASGTFKQVALPQLALAMHDPWLTGTGDGDYQLEAHGAPAPGLLTVTTGHLQFHLQSGVLSHVVVEGAPLKWRRFSGTLDLNNETFDLSGGQIESTATTYSVSGKATWTRSLDFKLASDTSPGVSITGTLAAPRVSSSPRSATQATLAP